MLRKLAVNGRKAFGNNFLKKRCRACKILTTKKLQKLEFQSLETRFLKKQQTSGIAFKSNPLESFFRYSGVVLRIEKTERRLHL